jgi:hypothetical protein
MSCDNLTVSNCSSCLAAAQAARIQCAWCPNIKNITIDNVDKVLVEGACVADIICGNLSFYACIPPSLFIPPECPDNCTGHGRCVNITECKQIQTMDQGAFIVKGTDENGQEVDLIYTCSDKNLNQTIAHNQSALCACLNPYEGVNCGILGTGINIKLAAGLAAGIIAAIVILGLLGLALCGGGAYAAASAVAAAPLAGVEINPLYTDPGTSGDNPLFA